MQGNKEFDFRFDALTFVAKQFGFLKRITLLAIMIDEQVKWMTFLFKPAVFFNMLQLTNAVKSWENVSSSFHCFGGLQFNVNQGEIGHLHGNGLLDVRIPKSLREHVKKLTFVEEHHLLREGNWISIKINRKSDMDVILRLLELIYKELSNKQA